MMQTMPEATKRWCRSKHVQENFMTISNAENILESKIILETIFSNIHTKNNPNSYIALQGAQAEISPKKKRVF